MDGASLLVALERERAEREAAVRALGQRVNELEARLGAAIGGGVVLEKSRSEGGVQPAGTSRPSCDSEGSSDEGDSDREDEWIFGPDPRLNDGKYTPAAGKEVTETDLDLTSNYQINGSVWDCCLFIGLDCLGTWRSIVLVFIMALSAGTQMYFCHCVAANMIDDPVSEDTLDALLYFRTSIMHDVRYADMAQGRSLAAQVCAGDDGYQMQWAGSQVSIMDNIHKALKSGRRLVIFALFMWLLTIIGEFDAIVRFLRAIAQVTKGKHTSLVEAGAGSITVTAISKKRFWAMVTFVAAPRLLIATVLGYIGIRFLVATIDPADILLNSIALAFVLDIDELIYTILAPRRAKSVLEHTEAIPLPEKQKGSFINSTVIKFVTVAILLAFSYHHGVTGVYARMRQAQDILCTGNQDFVVAVNPATGIVEATPSYPGNGSALSPQGLAVLQLAKPRLSTRDHWAVDPTYLEVSRSSERTAKLDIGMTDVRDTLAIFLRTGEFGVELEDTRPDRAVFDELMMLSSASVTDVAAHAACRDEIESAHLRVRMLELTGGDHENCTGVESFCDTLNATSARSICPVTCGCAEESKPAAGIFASKTYGCPVACEKALEAVMQARHAHGAAVLCGDDPPASFETNSWLRSYFSGLFEALISDDTIIIGMRHVLQTQWQYIGVPENKSDYVFRSLMQGGMVDLTSTGHWDFAPGVPHPRGLQGCAFWTSWEVTVMLGVDLCLLGRFRTLRARCPISCRCHGHMQECPLACTSSSGVR